MRSGVFLFLFFTTQLLSAQTVLLREDVNVGLAIPNEGPNRKHYHATFFSAGLHFGEPDQRGSELRWQNCLFVETGWRHKRELTRFYALGHDFSFNFRNLRVRQHEDKRFGGPAIHAREKLVLINANLLLFQRFNFLPNRGDHLGKYLDMGLYGEYAIWARHITQDDVEAENGYKRARTVLRGPRYLNRFNYGVALRYGISGISVFCTYRLSDMFRGKAPFDYPELPRFCAGISFDMNVNP